MKLIKSLEEYSLIIKKALKDKFSNINCYLMPDEVITLIKKQKLSYLQNQTTLQFMIEHDRYIKVCFYANNDINYMLIRTDKPIITDLPYSNQKSVKVLDIQQKLINQGFILNSSVTRYCLNELESNSVYCDNYLITEMQPCEAEKVFDIWEENFDPIKNLLYSKDEILAMPNAVYVIKNADNYICGAVELVISGRNAWIQRIAIKKQFQGKGIGAILEKFCINKCKTLGIKNILLYTINDNSNTSAFHKKFGFKPDGKYNCQFILRR